MKSLIYAFIILFTVHCSGQTENQPSFDPPKVFISEKVDYSIDFKEIYLEVMAHDQSRDITGRSETLLAKNILKKILNIDVDQLKVAPVGKYKIFLLPKLSEDRIRNIIRQIPKSYQKIGFEIFSPDFWWQLMKSIDESGLQVGVIEFIPGKNINGIYSNSLKVLGFDTLSVLGTLAHEARHAQQYDQLKQFSDRFWPESKECRPIISRVFAEIDAASHDLPYWSQSFTSIKTQTLLPLVEGNRILGLPQFYYFATSVDYPKTVLQSLHSSDSCSKKIKAWGETVFENIQPDVEELKEIAEKIEEKLSMIVFARYDSQNVSCPASDTQECQTLLQLESELDAEAFRFNQKIKETVKKRYQVLKEATQNLPKYYRRALARYIPGAKFIIEGEEK